MNRVKTLTRVLVFLLESSLSPAKNVKRLGKSHCLDPTLAATKTTNLLNFSVSFFIILCSLSAPFCFCCPLNGDACAKTQTAHNFGQDFKRYNRPPSFRRYESTET